MKKPVHVLQLGSTIRSIYNMVVIAVVDAQSKNKASVQDVVKKSKWWKRKPKNA
jgi:malate dehydrogenase (oxaloacetate-decarboxylating)(NADP+)